jgi:hypothetical protein
MKDFPEPRQARSRRAGEVREKKFLSLEQKYSGLSEVITLRSDYSKCCMR